MELSGNGYASLFVVFGLFTSQLSLLTPWNISFANFSELSAGVFLTAGMIKLQPYRIGGFVLFW